VKTLSIPEEH